MKNGLAYQLFSLIKTKGYVSYKEIEDKIVELGYKVDNGTKRLRELTTRTHDHIPMIEAVKEKGINVGYKYIGPDAKKVIKPVAQQSMFDRIAVKFKSHYE